MPGSTGFTGQLDASGKAEASLLLPPDPNQMLVGTPLYFAFVLTSPGPSLPLEAASNPIHVKYVP